MDEPARTVSPRARLAWAIGQLAAWGVLLAIGGSAAWAIDAAPFHTLLWAVPLAGLLCAPLTVPWLRWRRWRWELRAEGIDIRHGMLTVERTLIPWIRVQHVDTSRSLVEQALRLATVVVHTAAGEHHIPYLDAADAEQLRERIGASARADDA